MPRRGSARTTTRPSYQYSAAGPFDQWPSGMGFEYFYGFMGGETDQWTPFLFRDHTQIFPWIGQARLQPDHRHGGRRHQVPEGAERGRARQAVLPLLRARRHARAASARRRNGSTKFKGKFDMGWNELREQIFANQKRLGVIPANTQAHAVAGRTARIRRSKAAEMGHARRRREEALRASGGGLRRLRGLHRP